jgi:nucleoside-diphosphate-sugar epimerase
MRIFLTGATGYIGGAVAAALRKHDHEVAALVRPDADTRRLRDLGVVLFDGDLEALPSMREQLENFDAFVHTAQSRQNTVAADRAAVETFNGLSGFFVFTSGVWVLGNTNDARESSPVNPLELVAWRPAHEELAVGGGGAVIRPGIVYGGKQSILADWFAAAQQNRPLQMVGDGANRWVMVHVDELADLYVRVVEQQAKGVLHGIDDSDATVAEMARAIAPNGTIENIPLEAARGKLGPYADALAVDQRIASEDTRRATGWNPWKTFRTSLEEQWREWNATLEQTR